MIAFWPRPQDAWHAAQAQPKIKPTGRPTPGAPFELEGSGQVEGEAALVPSGTDLGWRVPPCFGDPRTGFRDQPVGTAPLRQAAAATSWPGARLDASMRKA
jgi:hypothetical protein